MRSSIYKVFVATFVMLFSSCDSFLDVVPDNVATVDYAFRLRSAAEKYLFTCYSYLPDLGNKHKNLGYSADELWLAKDKEYWRSWKLPRGLQNTNDPHMDYWNGDGVTDLWEGISQCNIFLENIETVPDMDQYEKKRWAAEVKFLKAYYHFYLLKCYGPIPIIDQNLPISASGEEVRVHRQPVDKVFDYVNDLIGEAVQDLPDEIEDENTEYGRITAPIALGMKAKILTYAASPLFNGNTDYKELKNADGTELFSTEYQPEKWERALRAIDTAIDLAHSVGYELYEFELTQQTRDISDSTKLKLTHRGTITERWNNEILWANTKSTTHSFQEWVAPLAFNWDQQNNNSAPNGSTGVTMNMASKYYTENGVPIDEDVTWNYGARFDISTAQEEDRNYLKMGEKTANFHFDREPRFYGSLGFDRGIWYGQGRFDEDNSYWLELKVGEYGGKTQVGWHAVTGYYAKKLVNYTNSNPTPRSYSAIAYPWVMLRLGDLYLLHAEVSNEVHGPGPETLKYLDMIREKAGLKGVVESWEMYSKSPNKPNTKNGLREIIHRERTIDMAFEGQRFWDVRRWKTAPVELNQPITGWDVDQKSVNGFYRQRILFDQTFGLKDYFWPLREYDLIVNKNLVQNPGW